MLGVQGHPRLLRIRPDVLDNYYLKGGAAMELRFAEGARATKDIDIGVSGERAARLALFQNALALGFDDFSFRLKGKPLNMEKVDAVRLELAIQYRTRAWQTIDVDLGDSRSGYRYSHLLSSRICWSPRRFHPCARLGKFQ